MYTVTIKLVKNTKVANEAVVANCTTLSKAQHEAQIEVNWISNLYSLSPTICKNDVTHINIGPSSYYTVSVKKVK